MKRIGSQLIITDDAKVLRNSMVEFSETGLSYSSVFSSNHESAYTIFFDGIISPPIISLSFRSLRQKTDINPEYQYILFSELIEGKKWNGKKYIFDFETEDLPLINSYFKTHYERLSQFESTEFITACTALPGLYLAQSASVAARLLWKDTNLADKKITGQTNISLI